MTLPGLIHSPADGLTSPPGEVLTPTPIWTMFTALLPPGLQKLLFLSPPCGQIIAWLDLTAPPPALRYRWPSPPRLPSPDKLDNLFWSDTLKAYAVMSASPVTLPSWTMFKKSVLSLGSSSKCHCHTTKSKYWLAALHGDQLSRDELSGALRSMYSDHCTRPSLPHPRWLPAAPSYTVPLCHLCPSFVPTPQSPWAASMVVSWKAPCPCPSVAPTIAPCHDTSHIHKLLFPESRPVMLPPLKKCIR